MSRTKRGGPGLARAGTTGRAGRLSPVRRTGKRDLDPVTALWIALTEYHASLESLFALRDGAEDEVRRIVDAQLRDPDTALFVHDEAPTLAGLCVVRVDRAPPVHAEVCRGEITDLFVREAARRRGIGRALAETAFDWARERGALRIEVRVAVANHAGRAFWQASGFESFMDVLHRRL